MSTCKGANISEFAEHRFIYTSIYDMICVFLSMYVRKKQGFKFEHLPGKSSQNMGSYTKVSVI